VIDLAELATAVFTRVASDPAGEAVRAKLATNTAARIISAEKLRQYASAGTLPAVAKPLLALRRGPAPRGDRVNILPRLTWYAYGDPAADHSPLDAFALPLWNLYRDWRGLGVYSVELSAGGHDHDRALGLIFVRYDLDIGSI
jgi:hypothetical protein